MKKTESSINTSNLLPEFLADAVVEVAEGIIDSQLADGVLKEIPFLNSIYGSVKAGRDIRNALFLRKVARFINEMAVTTPEERASFTNQFESDEDLNRLGETITLILDRTDDTEKPKIIGRLFVAAVRNKVPLEKILRSCAIVNNCYLQDLLLIPQFNEGPQTDELRPIAESLLSAGVLTSGGFDGGNMDERPIRSGTIFNLSEYGELLLAYGIENDT